LAKIKVTSKCELYDGMSITFNAPCDCTAVDGLKVYYGSTSQVFTFRDARGSTLTGVSNLFLKGAYVKVVLDTTRGYAYIQNAASNAYLEGRLNSILTNSTKTLYGLASNAVPDDAFKRLAQLYGAYGFEITLVTSDGLPIPNMTLTGLLNASRTGVAVTDANGKCFAISETPEVTVSIVPNTIGLTDLTTTLQASDTALVTPITITMPVDTSLRLIQTSGTYKVLHGHPVDLCVVGAGASGTHVGGGGSHNYGNGGGGGYANNILGEVFPANNASITLTVGAGGVSAGNGANSPGGTTTLKYKGKTATAQGAAGKEGNGTGGTGESGMYGSKPTGPGTAGQTRVFNDSSLPLPGGGGGGGCYTYQYSGGADFGGKGGRQMSLAEAGKGPGGGGGGGYFYCSPDHVSDNRTYPAGSGGKGGLYIRVKKVSS